MFSILKPFLFNLDPEKAHDLAIKSLKFNVIPEKFFKVENEEILETTFLKRKIKNPIGLAAGFDKSAEVYRSLWKFGFGLIEVGTVTPRKQFGNPKPRIFRLKEDEALINRLGFNNDGLLTVMKRLEFGVINRPGILGVNIGPNFDSSCYEADFCLCLFHIMKHSLADYVTINISSPNTENLREYQTEEKLESLMKDINRLKKESITTLDDMPGSILKTDPYGKQLVRELLKIPEKETKDIPVFLKISPDIEDSSVEKISEIIINQKISGVILTNTSNVNRSSLKSSNKDQAGGLSGKPIRELSTRLIKKFYKELKGKAYIIGVGGVDSGKSAFEKIVAGANVVQLYTGMIYKGPGIVKEIKKELIQILKEEGIKNIKEAIGKDT